MQTSYWKFNITYILNGVMQTESSIPTILETAFDNWLSMASMERVSTVAFLGRSLQLPVHTEDWPAELRTSHVFRIATLSTSNISKLRSLPELDSLLISDLAVEDEGAQAIASLTGLTSLNLSNNNIGRAGAQAIAASLTGLKSLNLANNNIDYAGAEAIASLLAGLTSLDLSHNNIGEAGARAVLERWSERRPYSTSSRLDLRDNPGLSRLLPTEIFESDNAQALLAAYNRFGQAQGVGRTRPLGELKLLVVGNEAVGKTSLLRYLIHNQPRNPAERRTEGIALHERIEVQRWSPQQCDVKLNVWDFGGQEMLRGTHRFFLTERSLYVLVLEDRRQDDSSYEGFLKTIRNCGGESPIIVVINKSDAGKQDLELDETGLRRTYPNIVGFARTSCDPGSRAENSIADLRRLIIATIEQDPRLRHVRDPIPDNWLAIKERVTSLATKRSVLPHADFISLCEKPGEAVEKVADPDEQHALLGLLHQLGVIIAHGLARNAAAASREINLLDPNWLTGAIYRILEKAKSNENDGEFTQAQFGEWLDPRTYPARWHEFILAVMQESDIGLCFKLPVADEERYLIPEALPPGAPAPFEEVEQLLRFRYRYSYLLPA